MSLVGEILSGIKTAADLIDRKDPRRAEVADLLERISASIDQIVLDYKAGRTSPRSLAEFAEYCAHFEFAIGSTLSASTQSRIRSLLRVSGCTDERISRAFLQQRQVSALTGEGLIVQSIKKVLPVSLNENALDEVSATSGKLKALAGILRSTRGKV